MAPRTTPPVTPPPITDPAEAQKLVGGLSEVMDALLDIVGRETAFVRAGRLREAAQLEATKTSLARRYASDAALVKASAPYLSQLVPGAVAALRERHQKFHKLLHNNLTVLATSHAVFEGIMRALSHEVARKASPQTYGASGRATAPKPQLGQSLTLSRVS
jgi:hypothetical protein